MKVEDRADEIMTEVKRNSPGLRNDHYTMAETRRLVLRHLREAVAEENDRCARIARSEFDVYGISSCIASKIRGE